MKAIYKGKEVLIIKNNYNGTFDIARSEGKSYVGENVWIGVERAVEKDELDLKNNLSNCCNASILENSDICNDCGEHCDAEEDNNPWLDNL